NALLPDLPIAAPWSWLAIAAAFALTGFFSVLRTALLHSVPSRILEGASPARSARLRPLLEHAEALATSASVFEITFQTLFVVLLYAWLGDVVATPGIALVTCVLLAVPTTVFAAEVVPAMLSADTWDALLRVVLPSFAVVQTPIGWLSVVLDAAKRATMRVFRIPERPRVARRIVEDLRDVVEDSDRTGELDETEREVLENLFDIHDADVAEIMTPRTELLAVRLRDGFEAVLAAMESSGFTRILVYEENLDEVLGVVYAKDVLGTVARSELDRTDLASILRPAKFVPETKGLSALLSEFRAEKQKLAVVLDEYGGTAGVVTMNDVVAEIVGESRAEFGEVEQEPIRRMPDGRCEILGSARIGEVNEALELDLPEEADYETLAGFVLSQLGRLPTGGEVVWWKSAQFLVRETNARRILLIEVSRELAQGA
ncbi:MAG: hemolysin family protein, partial [Planctomycetota bacterium]